MDLRPEYLEESRKLIYNRSISETVSHTGNKQLYQILRGLKCSLLCKMRSFSALATQLRIFEYDRFDYSSYTYQYDYGSDWILVSYFNLYVPNKKEFTFIVLNFNITLQTEIED